LITDKIDKKFHKKSSKKRTQQAENVKFFMNQKVKMKNEEIHSRFWVWVLVHHMNMCRCFFVNCVWSKENFSEEEWVRRREKNPTFSEKKTCNIKNDWNTWTIIIMGSRWDTHSLKQKKKIKQNQEKRRTKRRKREKDYLEFNNRHIGKQLH
jgi:hypothetical protein